MENLDSEILSQNPTRLNDQQLQMLRLKEPMTEEDYKLLKKEILFLKAKKLILHLNNGKKKIIFQQKIMNVGAKNISELHTTKSNAGCN